MVDLTTQYLHIQAKMDEAILNVVRSGQYINGEPVRKFASRLGEYTGAKYVIPCANGTDALQIALMALGLEEGDEVIVPAFTYAATAEVIGLLKLKPVLVDVNPHTFNIDPQKIEEALSPATRAIIPVHLFGQCCDMDSILKIANDNGLYVVEDNAQSIGSVYTFKDGSKKQAGTIGNIGTLSFFPTKNLGCYGDGGALLTDNEELAKKLKMITLHGQSEKYIHQIIGCNSRLDNIQAAILNVKLTHLNEYIEKRQSAARVYNEGFQQFSSWLGIPQCSSFSTHLYHQYTVKVNPDIRENFRAYLKEAGIPSVIYYPLPLHHQPAFKDLVRIGSDLSESENLCRSVFSLPMHTELSEEQLNYIISKITDYEKSNIRE